MNMGSMFAFSDIFDYLCMTIYLYEQKTIRWLVKVLFYHTSINAPQEKKRGGRRNSVTFNEER